MSSSASRRQGQLGLAFDECDFGKPQHDEIMLWLSLWVRQRENICTLLRPKFRYRRKSVQHVTSLSTDKLLEIMLPHQKRCLQDQFSRDMGYTDPIELEESADEPLPVAEFKQLQWEYPLVGTGGRVVGFCDLYCEYKIGDGLIRQEIIEYDLHDVQAGDAAQKRPSNRSFIRSGSTEKWDQHLSPTRLFFEVKTEIINIGELMRQLQVYRHSRTARRAEGINTHFIVVAPANSRVEAVCLDQDIHFLEFKPDWKAGT